MAFKTGMDVHMVFSKVLVVGLDVRNMKYVTISVVRLLDFHNRSSKIIFD